MARYRLLGLLLGCTSLIFCAVNQQPKKAVPLENVVIKVEFVALNDNTEPFSLPSTRGRCVWRAQDFYHYNIVPVLVTITNNSNQLIAISDNCLENITPLTPYQITRAVRKQWPLYTALVGTASCAGYSFFTRSYIKQLCSYALAAGAGFFSVKYIEDTIQLFYFLKRNSLPSNQYHVAPGRSLTKWLFIPLKDLPTNNVSIQIWQNEKLIKKTIKVERFAGFSWEGLRTMWLEKIYAAQCAQAEQDAREYERQQKEYERQQREQEARYRAEQERQQREYERQQRECERQQREQEARDRAEQERQQREYERQQKEYERQQREQEARDRAEQERQQREYERQQKEYERQQREQEARGRAEQERQQREQREREARDRVARQRQQEHEYQQHIIRQRLEQERIERERLHQQAHNWQQRENHTRDLLTQ